MREEYAVPDLLSQLPMLAEEWAKHFLSQDEVEGSLQLISK